MLTLFNERKPLRQDLDNQKIIGLLWRTERMAERYEKQIEIRSSEQGQDRAFSEQLRVLKSLSNELKLERAELKSMLEENRKKPIDDKRIQESEKKIAGHEGCIPSFQEFFLSQKR